MKARKKLYVIAYDISDNKNRSRIEKLISRHGKRVNKSVFECMVTEGQYNKLVLSLSALIDVKTDDIVIYKVCVDCYASSCSIPVKKHDIQRIKIL